MYIYETLASKFNCHCKVTMTKSGYNTDGVYGVKYSFEKDGISYAAIYETYQNSRGSSFFVEKNGTLVSDKEELSNIHELAKKIFVPTDPELKKAMAAMSKKALSKAIQKQYPPKKKDI